jgi:hypothetical protein
MHVPYAKFKSLLSKFLDPDDLQIDRPVSDPKRSDGFAGAVVAATESGPSPS